MSSSWNQIKEPKDMEEILNDTITAQELEVFIEFRNFLHLFFLFLLASENLITCEMSHLVATIDFQFHHMSYS